MNTRIIGIVLAGLALAGCQDELERDEQSVIEAQEEVRKARTEGAREVGEAQREASKDVAEERREAGEDVAKAREELREEMADLEKTLAEKRADPDLSAEERAKLDDYERRHATMKTRLEGADERSDWDAMRTDMKKLGDEVDSWGRR